MRDFPRTSSSIGRALVSGLVLGLASFGTAARADDADLIKRGEYLATAGDCVACHTGPGGEKLAGGLYLKTPIGDLSTPNITPDKETGIGGWTDDQFYRAMHEGIGAKDEYLYPAFPFPWYTKVTKEDALAIKAYLFSLKPVHAPRKEIKIGFPFDVRTGLLTWRTLFFKAGTFEPDPKQNAEYNRGAYLVEGLGHCGECHNKSKLMGASVWSGQLKGGAIEGYYAPNITANGHDSAGLWKKEDIVAYLKTGSKPDHTSVAAGPMKETITHSLSKLNDADLGAMATYLKAVGERDAKPEAKAGPSAGLEAAPKEGAYLSYCSSCHGVDGKGVKNRIPALAGNGSVTAGGPQNVIQAVLGGIPAQNGLAPMPALGQTMSDAEVAEAVNYARHAWGNNASVDTGAGEVASLRSKANTMLAMNGKNACKPASDKTDKLPGAVDSADVKGKLEKMDQADMLATIDAILPGIKSSAPQATPDQITNALTAAYCPIAMEKVQGGDKSIVMGQFATLVYGQAVRKPGERN